MGKQVCCYPFILCLGRLVYARQSKRLLSSCRLGLGVNLVGIGTGTKMLCFMAMFFALTRPPALDYIM